MIPPYFFSFLIQGTLVFTLLFLVSSPYYSFSSDPFLALAPLAAILGFQFGLAWAYPISAPRTHLWGRIASLAIYSPLIAMVLWVERTQGDWVLRRPWLSIRRLWSAQDMISWVDTYHHGRPLVRPPAFATEQLVQSVDGSLRMFQSLYPDLVSAFQPPQVPLPGLVIPPTGLLTTVGGFLSPFGSSPSFWGVVFLTLGGLLTAYIGRVGVFAASTGEFAEAATVTDKLLIKVAEGSIQSPGYLGELVATLLQLIKSMPHSPASRAELSVLANLLLHSIDIHRAEIAAMAAAQSSILSFFGDLNALKLFTNRGGSSITVLSLFSRFDLDLSTHTRVLRELSVATAMHEDQIALIVRKINFVATDVNVIRGLVGPRPGILSPRPDNSVDLQGTALVFLLAFTPQRLRISLISFF